VHVCKNQNKTKHAHDVRKIFNYEKRFDNLLFNKTIRNKKKFEYGSMIRQGDKLFRTLQVEKGFVYSILMNFQIHF
jgi:hypothetical protein